MNISVIGLGLIGGSFCKTIKKHTTHTCCGYDINPNSVNLALQTDAIDRAITLQELGFADLTIIGLHPQATVEFLQAHAAEFQPGSIIMDTAGVKQSVIAQVHEILAQQGVSFVGCHPMAGREFSGFAYAEDTLFEHASFIMTPVAETSQKAIETVQGLAKELLFKNVILASPEEHDQIIAFTSQLAHVVSNAYVKSPSMEQESGFSAGSFLDLTRVAKLNETMWSELFLMNQKPLLNEIEQLIGHLEEYSQAIQQNNAEQLRCLLKDGRIRKEQSLERMNPSK